MVNVPVIKNNEYIVDIIDNGYQGEGIAKINNFTIKRNTPNTSNTYKSIYYSC